MLHCCYCLTEVFVYVYAFYELKNEVYTNFEMINGNHMVAWSQLASTVVKVNSHENMTTTD